MRSTTGSCSWGTRADQCGFFRVRPYHAALSHATGIATGFDNFDDAILTGALQNGVLIPYPSTFKNVDLMGANLEEAVIVPKKLTGLIGCPVHLPSSHVFNPDPLRENRFWMWKTH